MDPNFKSDWTDRFRYWTTGGYNTEAFKRRFVVRIRRPLVVFFYLWRGIRYPYTLLEELRAIRHELWKISACAESSFGSREAHIRTLRPKP